MLIGLDEGSHDGKIAGWLDLLVDIKPVKKSKKFKPDKKFKQKGPVYTIEQLVNGKPGMDVWFAWKKAYSGVLMNPAKAKAKGGDGLELDKFQFPEETHFLKTGDATMQADWQNILGAAQKAGVYPGLKKNKGDETTMNVVVFTSLPWGVLENSRASYERAIGEEDASDHEDVELTDIQIGNFANNAFVQTPRNTPMVLHLPALALGKYAAIFERNGWEATRNPITIVTKAGSKVNRKTLHVCTRPDA